LKPFKLLEAFQTVFGKLLDEMKLQEAVEHCLKLSDAGLKLMTQKIELSLRTL
jgi:hypothetical protein